MTHDIVIRRGQISVVEGEHVGVRAGQVLRHAA